MHGLIFRSKTFTHCITKILCYSLVNAHPLTPHPSPPHPLTPSPQGEGDESPQQEDAPPVPAYREPSPSPDPRGGEWEEGDEDEGQQAVMKYDFTGEYVCVCVTVRTSDSMF